MDAVDYKHKINKVMTEKEAVSVFLHDGDSFTVGGFLGNRESDCVFREIARQGQKDLTYVEESATTSADILIGLDRIARFDTAYIGHRALGAILGYPNLERCLTEGNPRPANMGGFLRTVDYEGNRSPIEFVDWSNFMISLRFVAGALNVPFMPCRSSFGTDILNYNKEIKIINDPFNNEPLLLIPAMKPDVAFLAVQRADQRGNGQIWGHKGVDEWKARAAKRVVLFTEEIVPTEKIYENPTNTLIPAFCTDAVVQLPFNSHPWAVYGCYAGDMLCVALNGFSNQTRDGFLKWADEWVFGCKDHHDYCEKVGWENLYRLAKAEHSINRIPN